MLSLKRVLIAVLALFFLPATAAQAAPGLQVLSPTGEKCEGYPVMAPHQALPALVLPSLKF